MRTSYILPALLTLTTTAYALPTDSPVQANGGVAANAAAASSVDPNVVAKIVTDARQTVYAAAQKAAEKINAAVNTATNTAANTAANARVDVNADADTHVSARTVGHVVGSGTNGLTLEAIVALGLQGSLRSDAGSKKREAEAEPTVPNGGVNAGTGVAVNAVAQATVDRLVQLYLGVGLGAGAGAGVSA